MRKRIATFLVGGLGGGIEGQGFPAIKNITEGLASTFDVSAHMLRPALATFRPAGYAFRSPPDWLDGRARKLRWPFLAADFLRQHRQRPFSALLSFWGYPMGTFTVALAALVGKPSVVVLMGAETASVPSIGYGYLGRPVMRRVILKTCAHASVVITVSDHQRQILREEGLRRDDVRVIPLGSDGSLFTFRPRSAAAGAPVRLLHVANLTQVKDQDTLIRGFALLRQNVDARLRIIGPDHLDGQLHRLAAELGVASHVEFLGGLPHSALPAHFDWADIFVLTSLSESQNNALTEAAMTGVLQVSTPVGTVRDLGDDIAVVIRPRDPVDLAAKIQAILSQPSLWRQKVMRARSWAERHDLNWTVNELTRVLDGLS
jgi:glycosyltransferase involved in cell wall biosynthesis